MVCCESFSTLTSSQVEPSKQLSVRPVTCVRSVAVCQMKLLLGLSRDVDTITSPDCFPFNSRFWNCPSLPKRGLFRSASPSRAPFDPRTDSGQLDRPRTKGRRY